MSEQYIEGADEVRCYTPDPDAYHAADNMSVATAQGQSMAQVGARFGGRFRGVVVPHVRSGSVSPGWNPFNPPSRVVQMINGNAPPVAVDLGRISPAVAAAACDVANASVTTGSDFGTVRRDRTAQAFAAIAAAESTLPVAPRDLRGRYLEDPLAGNGVFVTRPQRPQAPGPAPMNPYPTPFSKQAGGLPARPPGLDAAMARFRGLSGGGAAPAAAPAALAVPDGPEPPTTRVTFDLNGDDQEAYYHAAVFTPGEADSGCLALVYDNRFHGPRYFPRARRDPFGLRIAGMSTTMLAASTGIQFEFQHWTFCLLMVLAQNPSPEAL